MLWSVVAVTCAGKLTVNLFPLLLRVLFLVTVAGQVIQLLHILLLHPIPTFCNSGAFISFLLLSGPPRCLLFLTKRVNILLLVLLSRALEVPEVESTPFSTAPQ